MTIYVSQCEGCSHNNQHDQSNQDPNQGFGYLPVPLKLYRLEQHRTLRTPPLIGEGNLVRQGCLAMRAFVGKLNA
jgi:hypothetical protein